MVNNKLKERFLKYVSFDTQSDESSSTIPSTSKQLVLGEYLTNELKSIGIDNAYMDCHGYVYAYLKSNCKSNNTIGLLAHMDTSDEASGANILPQIITNYDGGKIVLSKDGKLVLDPVVFPSLLTNVGHELITTSGDTLLGADDKAGIAIIMTVVDELLHSNIEYPNIIVTFTPDEEIGRGTDAFNYEYYKEHNCNIAYTLDGDACYVLNYENFNAATAKLTFNGKSIHPGSAKNKMVNSMLLAMEFNSLLPVHMVPSATEGYEGFNHLVEINGSVSCTNCTYIIRNHCINQFNDQKEMFVKASKFMNDKYGDDTVILELIDSYYNMNGPISEKLEIIEAVKNALIDNGLSPVVEPIRGGTDGARLTYGGIYTPNLGTGGGNYHGPFEYLDVDEASIMVNVVKSLLKQFN